MYRVNKKGLYNVPMGKNSPSWDAIVSQVRDVSQILNKTNISISVNIFQDFFNINEVTCNDFVYADPPYHMTFSGYDGSCFNEKDQTDLHQFLDNLPCTVVTSNSNTDFIKKLYNSWSITEVSASRSINSDIKLRKAKNVEVMMIKSKVV
jgi:DNA adenine methylase Dam